MKRLEKYLTNQFPQDKEHYKSLGSGQSPKTFLITCPDSRILPNEITQSRAGELFVLRNAGNIIAPYCAETPSNEALTLEYAVRVLEVEESVVCGHAKCGAMDGILNIDQLTELKSVHAQLKKCSSQFTPHKLQEISNKENALGELINENVKLQMKNIMSYDFVKEAVEAKKLDVFGWVYDFEHGKLISNFDL